MKAAHAAADLSAELEELEPDGRDAILSSPMPPANGKRLGYFYSWDDANTAHQLGDVLTADEARRIAESLATCRNP